FDDRAGIPAAREVDDELAEDLDLDVVDHAVEGRLDELDALGDVEHRRLVLRGPDDADDDAVEDARGAGDHVDGPVRHGVGRPGVDGSDDRSNSVRRADPYLRDVRTSRPGTSGGSSRPADS